MLLKYAADACCLHIGVIDINDEIGDTGLLDGNGFNVVITNPDAEMAAQSAQA
jgi:hypothetical protein